MSRQHQAETPEFPNMIVDSPASRDPEKERELNAINFFLERFHDEIGRERAQRTTMIKTRVLNLVIRWIDLVHSVQDFTREYDVDGDPGLRRSALSLITMVRSSGHSLLADPDRRGCEPTRSSAAFSGLGNSKGKTPGLKKTIFSCRLTRTRTRRKS